MNIGSAARRYDRTLSQSGIRPIMRGRLKKHVFCLFEKALSERFPEFVVHDKDQTSWKWRWEFAPGLTFFVYIQDLNNHEQFVLEIAWSDDGEFPWKSFGRGKVDQAKGRLRLGTLWKSVGFDPSWDLAPEKTELDKQHIDALARGERQPYPTDLPIEQLLPRAEPLVRDAVDKFEQYGIPLFRQVDEARTATRISQ